MMEGKGKLFTIEYYMPSFEPQNQSVCKQHASMFKNDKFMFNHQKDLVISMLYQFVANLKSGQFTPLDNQRLKYLNGILKEAKSNFIKQIRLVRLLSMNYFGNRSITFRNSNEDVMYKVVIKTNGSSFLVNLDQVCDIVGQEDWIHGEVNCLSNLASSRTITLSWGAKKKESINRRSILSDEGLQVGNLVVVENHGKRWPHKAEIVDLDMKINTAWIRCETTQKKI